MEVNLKETGERIKILRAKKGYSLQDLADKLGINKSSIHSWEVGRNLPSQERLLALSKIFDVSVNEILYGFNDERIIKILNDLTSSEKNVLKALNNNKNNKNNNITLDVKARDKIINNLTHHLKRSYDVQYIPDETIKKLLTDELESYRDKQKTFNTEVFNKVLSNAMSEKDNILHSIDELSIFNEYSETYKLIEELHSVVLELDEKDNSTNAVQLKRIKAILDIIIDRKDMYYHAYYQKSIHGDFYENIELVTLKNKVENAFNSIRIAINKLDK